MLCPLLAWAGHVFHCHTSKGMRFSGQVPFFPSLIEIVIPAHNEAEMIGATLASIRRSMRHLYGRLSLYPMPEVRIHVGADACTDQTAQIARQFRAVSVTEFPGNNSKWLTLKALCAESPADWLILVDAGTLWPENFLLEVVQRVIDNKNIIGVSPAYKPIKGGRLHGMVWCIEKWLKKMEGLCGGPISVHGATVCYTARHLKEVLSRLGNTCWLNDDVVIPLMLRSLYPDGVILYPVGEVSDVGIQTDRVDYRRRKRILFGNLQWVGGLLPYCLNRNPIAGIVAARRVFRVFWAYWVALTLLSLAWVFHVVLPGLAGIVFATAIFGSFRELAGAAFVSFIAPFRLVRPVWRFQGVWK